MSKDFCLQLGLLCLCSGIKKKQEDENIPPPDTLSIPPGSVIEIIRIHPSMSHEEVTRHPSPSAPPPSP